MSLLFDTPQECLVKTTFKDSCATLFFTLPASSIYDFCHKTPKILAKTESAICRAKVRKNKN